MISPLPHHHREVWPIKGLWRLPSLSLCWKQIGSWRAPDSSSCHIRRFLLQRSCSPATRPLRAALSGRNSEHKQLWNTQFCPIALCLLGLQHTALTFLTQHLSQSSVKFIILFSSSLMRRRKKSPVSLRATPASHRQLHTCAFTSP